MTLATGPRLVGAYSLDRIVHLALRVLDLAPGRPEGLSDRDEGVLVLGRVVAASVDDDVLLVRHGDSELDLEHVAVAVPALRPRDDHVATGCSGLNCSSRRACAAISARTSSDG